MTIRLSQLEATAISTIENNGSLENRFQKFPEGYADRLIKRGLVSRYNGGLTVTSEGRAAFRRWVG